MKRRTFISKFGIGLIGSYMLTAERFAYSKILNLKSDLPNVLILGDSISIG
jgi:hypothetical protein